MDDRRTGYATRNVVPATPEEVAGLRRFVAPVGVSPFGRTDPVGALLHAGDELREAFDLSWDTLEVPDLDPETVRLQRRIGGS